MRLLREPARYRLGVMLFVLLTALPCAVGAQ